MAHSTLSLAAPNPSPGDGSRHDGIAGDRRNPGGVWSCPSARRGFLRKPVRDSGAWEQSANIADHRIARLRSATANPFTEILLLRGCLHFAGRWSAVVSRHRGVL